MSLLKNSTIVIAGVVVSNLLAYVFHFIAGRMLGPEDYGTFGALMALYSIIGLPSGALSFAITKYTARFNSENEIGKISALRKRIQNDVIVFSGIMLLLIIIFSNFIANFLKINSIFPVIIVGITLVFALLLPVNSGILLGMKKFRIVGLNAMIEATSRLFLLIIFLYLGLRVNGAILAYGLAYFVTYLMVFPYIKEIRDSDSSEKRIEIKTIYRFVFQVLLINILIQIIINVPSLYIKHFYSSEFTGYWTAALNIARISLFISAAIALVMFPEIVDEKDPLKKRKIFDRAAILVLFASSVIALLFFMIPQTFILILYSSAYIGAVPLLKWLGFVMIFIGFLQLCANYWLAKLK